MATLQKFGYRRRPRSILNVKDGGECPYQRYLGRAFTGTSTVA